MNNIDYEKIIKRSWILTWKNKWLWVVGLVLAAFGGGSGGSSNYSNITKNIPESSPAPVPTNLKDKTVNVLGTATDIFKNWVNQVPISSWVLIGLCILVFIVFTTIVVWIVTSWAKGALISGLNDADLEKEVNLKTISPSGIKNIKELVMLRLISMLIAAGVIIAIALIIGIGFLIKAAIPTLGIIWLTLFGILGALSFVVSIFLFGVIAVYAERLVVLKGFKAFTAWKKGLSLGKGNLLPSFLMSLINSVAGCVMGCAGTIILAIIFGIPVYLLAAPMFKGGFHFSGVGPIFGIAIIAILFFSINALVRAVIVVFTYGNWNLLFKSVWERNEANV